MHSKSKIKNAKDLKMVKHTHIDTCISYQLRSLDDEGITPFQTLEIKFQ